MAVDSAARPSPTADTSRLTAGCTHGKVATYSKGCRCDECREVWRGYRRDKVRAYRQRKARERDLERARQLLREAGEL